MPLAIFNGNPDKFQFIVFTKGDPACTISLNSITLSSQSAVKLLGLTINTELNFKSHIDEICKKAGRQLNVLVRL